MTKVEIDNGQLFYTKHNGGNKILLAFHGFGQDNKIFTSWIEFLNEEYTVYTFDLFYHGKSNRSYGSLSKSEWAEYLNTFLEQEGITEFTTLGFSLGGRFAIAASLSFPEKTKELILIAPDAVHLTIWFKLATNPSVKWLFKYFMLNPDKLERLLKFNDRYKIVSSYLRDFVDKELGNPDNRKRVYISWNHFKSTRIYQKAAFKRIQKAHV